MHAILPSLGSSITHGKRKETKKTQCYSTEYMAGGVQKVSQAMDRDTGSINDPGTAEHTRGIGRA
jgi:hypothetical protein